MRRKILPLIMVISMILAFTALTVQSYGQPGGMGSGKEPGMASAPGGGPPPNMIEMRMKMLQERLDLKTDQATKIRAILEADQRVGTADREKNQGDREAAMKAREKHRTETDSKIKAVLTKDQVVKYDKMMEEFRQTHMNGPGMGKPKDTGTSTSNSAGRKGDQGSGK